MLKDLAEHSDIDYEKTFQARELAFVTKDGKEFWSPVWHLYIQSLINNAGAKLVAEGCHKYPRSYIMLYKEKEQKPEVKEPKQINIDKVEEKKEAEKPKTTRKSSK